jgi:hypothetical protein
VNGAPPKRFLSVACRRSRAGHPALRERSGAGVGDHLDAAPVRLVRPDHDRQAGSDPSDSGQGNVSRGTPSGGTTISTDAVALFWRALDAFDYWVRQARLWMLDTLHGPEQETEADRQRGCEREPSQHSGLPRAAGVVPPVTNAPKWGRWLTRVG